MQLSEIQRTDEKVLFCFAVLFSAFVWLGIVSSIVFLATRPVNPVDFCIFYDEFEEEYYHLSNFEVETAAYEYECLPESEVPAETYEEVETHYHDQAVEERIAMFSIFAMVFMYIGAFLLFIYVSNALAMAFIRLNGVRLSPSQHPAFFKLYEAAAKKLGVTKLPPAYIIDAAGEANAFAIKIARRKMVVFYDELIDRLTEEKKTDELLAVAGHELTHVKLKHIQFWILLLPFNLIPFAQAWLSRLREYSADRGALFVTNNVDAVSKALIKIVVGARTARDVNIEEYINASYDERGIFVSLVKIMAAHPPVPMRIHELRQAGRV